MRPRRGVRWLGVVAGALLAPGLLGGCTPGGPANGPIPRLAEYAGREVREIELAGDLQIPEDSVRRVLVTRATSCRVPLLPLSLCPRFARSRSYLSLAELQRDVLRLQLFYRDHGYYGTRVEPTVDPLPNNRIAVRFGIVPGHLVILRELTVEGTEGIIEPEELERQLPLQEGEPFRRSHFTASADTIRSALHRRGYAYADVLRNYALDTIADVAEAHFTAIPGPLVHVDTVVFVGIHRLTQGTARSQLTFREGSILRAAELNRSQRNLFDLDLVSFASIEIAPDTLQRDLDPAAATVLVRIVEAPRYGVDATAGYGTIDCLRGGARWTDRNFFGGARRLDITGSVSRIGVGSPTAWGLEGGPLCRELEDDPFRQYINYRVSATVEQPRLFTARERVGISLHAERTAELDAFLRESYGGQLAVMREIGERTLITPVLDIEYGYTDADAAMFCVGFDVCTPEDVALLRQSRWSNTLTLNAIHDRTRTDAFRVRGSHYRAGVTWASPLLGSDDRYTRLIGDASWYRSVRPDWVLAGRLHGGSFLDTELRRGAAFIPPERRFYAGGPNTVRGFARNALGPRVYVAPVDTLRAEGFDPDEVRSSAVGGTQMVVGSVELRMPSPVLGRYLRLAAFVDAGQVWVEDTLRAAAPIRVTPGAGIRFDTPVGPIRLDVGYNPYPREPGPLYLWRGDELFLHEREYHPGPRTFWQRFQLHFAVGQAF
jgi:outer membrane protein insertion porin family